MGYQQHWSTTAGSNNTADANINWREGMDPRQVNDSSRAMMAALAKFLDDINGTIATGGTSTAYTATTNEGWTSLVDGMTLALRMSATSGASPTLNVDNLGAVAIQQAAGTAVETGALVSGSIYLFTYYAASPAWLVRQAPATAALRAPAGTKMLFFNTSAPTGWTKDTSLDDATIRLVSGAVGADASSNPAMTASLAQRTIAIANLPAHNHGPGTLAGTLPDHVHPYTSPGGSIGVASGGTNAASAGTGSNTGNPTTVPGIAMTSGTTGNTGSGTAMDFRVRYADAIRAEKA